MAMKCLCAADLTHLLSVEKNEPTTNSDGQKAEAWSEKFKLWAKVTSRGGMERRVFEQLRAECDYAVEFFWNSQSLTIKPADYRFVEDGRTLNIAAVYDPDGRKQQLVAHCTEIVI